MALKAKWIDLHLASTIKQGSETKITKVLSINYRKFILYVETQDGKFGADHKFYEYNVSKDEMIEIDIPVLSKMANALNFKSWAINPKTDTLYVSENRRTNVIQQYNLETKQCIETIVQGLLKGTILYRAYTNHFLFINNHLHIFEGPHHCISMVEDENIAEVSRKKLPDHNHKKKLTKSETVFVPSKGIVLIASRETPCFKSFWFYSLKTQIWNRIPDIRYKATNGFGCVVSSNERYIILAGGQLKHHTGGIYGTLRGKSYIFVLDMKDDNEWQLKKSQIECPQPGRCILARTGGVDSKDDLLVAGFIEEAFEDPGLKNIQLPPSHVEKMILDKYSAEIIHWVHVNGNHCGLYLSDILDSLHS